MWRCQASTSILPFKSPSLLSYPLPRYPLSRSRGDENGSHLGMMGTIADAEALGVSLAWQTSDTVALDSQGIIQRIYRLATQAPRSWIEERLVRQMAEKPRALMWVKGHSGVGGNEEADGRAKREVWMGERMHWPDIVTPAGIRQAFPLHDRAPGHLQWNRVALRGLTYLVTDKGPQR